MTNVQNFLPYILVPYLSIIFVTIGERAALSSAVRQNYTHEREAILHTSTMNIFKLNFFAIRPELFLYFGGCSLVVSIGNCL